MKIFVSPLWLGHPVIPRRNLDTTPPLSTPNKFEEVSPKIWYVPSFGYSWYGSRKQLVVALSLRLFSFCTWSNFCDWFQNRFIIAMPMAPRDSETISSVLLESQKRCRCSQKTTPILLAKYLGKFRHDKGLLSSVSRRPSTRASWTPSYPSGTESTTWSCCLVSSGTQKMES